MHAGGVHHDEKERKPRRRYELMNTSGRKILLLTVTKLAKPGRRATEL
jgi:hypothetical protein